MNRIIDNKGNYAIKGTVQVYEKDKSGSALQLCLQTDEFEKYIIENSTEYEELFSLIGKKLLIFGEKLILEHTTVAYIRIKSYKTLNSI